MTAPVLAYKKFWIVKPAGGTNYIKNPCFDPPDGTYGWAATSVAATIESYADDARRGAYSIKVTPVSGANSGMYYHAGLPVNDGSPCTFSCDVKGVAGQVMKISITNGSDVVKDYTQFTATGYWQRVEVGFTATETATDYKVFVLRNSIASVEPFYVDGAQFEMTSSATTLIHGYAEGCRWTGTPRKSYSYRTNTTAAGGRLLDLSTYCKIVSVSGLGHGDWNQILTKMTSGGDMYQTHIRKSRQFSIVVDFIGDTLGAIEANRKAVIDAIRPDLAPGQERIVRYQGFAANGDEATQPVDIKCVPLSASLVDTPDIPSHQRAVLNFAIPSGLLDGAYNEGKELDLYVDFPAEFIVKRDANGNWCTVNGANHDSLITGLNGTVYCMAEGPDGKIYVGGDFTAAGGTTDADLLARWDPVSEIWEKVVANLNINVPNNGTVYCMDFDANGDLYIGGIFYDGVAYHSGYYYICKITDLDGTPTINKLDIGPDGPVYSILCAPYGEVYVGGSFNYVRNTSGGVSNTTCVAVWLGTYWDALGMGLNNIVRSMAISGDGNLYLGGDFTNAGAYGDYLCYFDLDHGAWNKWGSYHRVLADVLNGRVRSIAFDKMGRMYIGGDFTNAVLEPNADYIARVLGYYVSPLSTGTNGNVNHIFVDRNNLYASGSFTTAGGLTVTDRVAVWSNGAWHPLDIDLPGTAQINAILPASDGSLYIGGAFSTAGTAGTPNAETGLVALNLNVASASANTYPYMQITGPGTLKSITNYLTGKSIMFDGLTLQAGETISLKFDPLDLQFKGGWAGRGNLMRYVVPGSDYGDFYLRPGSNLLSMYMTGTDSNSGAWITWTPLFWGLDGAVLK